MADEHERYEQLAVGHVLGGLVADEDADFRGHLLGCRDCRTRVAELRGIAADLAAAERDERARSRLRIEAPRRVVNEDEGDERDQHADGPSLTQRITVRHVTIAVVVVLAFAGAMAFWNLHLRTAAATYAAMADQQAEVLGQLASGQALEAELAPGLVGQVVTDGTRVAFNVSGLQPLAVGERLVAWLIDGPEGAPLPVLLVRGTQVDDGALAAVFDTQGAEVLVLTRERGDPGMQPSGDELLRAPLR
jgi:hypothetical protein